MSAGLRVALLANPVAGRGRGAAVLREALRELEHREIPFQAWTTATGRDAVRLARELPPVDLLFLVGGDGTLRDAVDGLIQRSAPPPPVALLPAGTGNDLARHLGLPGQLKELIHVGIHGAERSLDVWRWNDVPFVNVAGIGLDAAVARAVNRSRGRLRGMAAYLAALATVLPRAQPFPLRIEWPGGLWHGRVWLAAFANATHYGGGLPIAPNALPDDGCLDVVVVESVPRLELLRQLPRLMRGAHLSHPRVKRFRVEEVGLDAPPQDATLDGELLAGAPARICRAAFRLRVRVPEAGAGVPRLGPPLEAGSVASLTPPRSRG